jgi:hypothetical protein
VLRRLTPGWMLLLAAAIAYPAPRKGDDKPALNSSTRPARRGGRGPGREVQAIRVEAENVINGTVVRTTYWHAAGLGMVKFVTSDKGGDRPGRAGPGPLGPG